MVKKSFKLLFSELKKYIYLYDGEHIQVKMEWLKAISKSTLPRSEKLLEYHDVLLFLSAHPENSEIEIITQRELNRISQFSKKDNTIKAGIFDDTGLPYTKMITRFSHDLMVWMYPQADSKMSVDAYDESGIDLNTLLKMTLSACEREETTAGLDNTSLLDVLKVSKKEQLSFLLNEFSKLDSVPLVKDYLWESLKLFIQIQLKDKSYSRSFNRISSIPLFYQTQILKKFNHTELINSKIPTPKKLSLEFSKKIEAVIKKSLILTLRETDPSTYMDLNTLKYFELERGVSIAIYGMIGDRQLALQSYIGYTLFKNGYPAAYGGSWIFGKMAKFGLNIFEAFRGGESGYMMCQLLRVYRQVFDLDYFEVEPYQYGLDNPDGIKSGAFWFYYRYDFKPVDPQLRRIAEQEHSKIKANRLYRSNSKTLIGFTESNIELNLGRSTPIRVSEILSQITKMISKKYNSNRVLAFESCFQEFQKKTGQHLLLSDKEKNGVSDILMLANALDIKDEKRLKILQNMILMKPVDPYQYNVFVQELFR